jgi:SAM-dependent methyltransferase
MSANGKPQGYFGGCNERLLHIVPASAKRIVEVGCGDGNLGAALKKLDAERVVWGIERNPQAAANASKRLDQVHTLDIQDEDPPLEPSSVDCVLFGDVLEHLVSPEDVLRRTRRWLAPCGIVLASVPNIQHHSVIADLLRSDFQYAEAGLLDATHLRFFTYSTLIKLFLDAGFEPEIVDTTVLPAPKEFLAAAQPLLKHLGLDASRTQRCLDACQYIFQGTPLAEPPGDGQSARPLTFVACVSNEAILQANLLSSPCLRSGTPHEVLVVRHCRSAAEGLNEGIRRAKHDAVVCVHQDVYLPEGWVERFWNQFELAHERFSPLGVLGVYGIHRQGAYMARAGYVVDRDHVLKEPEPLPASVDSLDEIVLAIPKGVPVEFDPALGFHFYGSDICMAAKRKGLQAVAIDALCFHNSVHVGVPPQFSNSARTFASKWSSQLPLVTSCAIIDGEGSVRVA